MIKLHLNPEFIPSSPQPISVENQITNLKPEDVNPSSNADLTPPMNSGEIVRDDENHLVRKDCGNSIKSI